MTLEGVTQFLALLTEKLPPVGATRHCLLLVDGELAVSVSIREKFHETYFLDPEDQKKEVTVLVDEVIAFREKHWAEMDRAAPENTTEQEEEVDPDLWHASLDEG